MSETATIHGFTVTRAEGLTDEQRENNRKWVEALRSGEYKQAKNYLKTCGGMCCLGVAEDITGAKWVNQEGGKWVAFRDLDDEEDVSPTGKARSLYGFADWHDGFLVRDFAGTDIHLSGLNDDRGLTFDQIADLVAYWAGLEEAPVA